MPRGCHTSFKAGLARARKHEPSGHSTHLSTYLYSYLWKFYLLQKTIRSNMHLLFVKFCWARKRYTYDSRRYLFRLYNFIVYVPEFAISYIKSHENILLFTPVVLYTTERSHRRTYFPKSTLRRCLAKSYPVYNT